MQPTLDALEKAASLLALSQALNMAVDAVEKKAYYWDEKKHPRQQGRFAVGPEAAIDFRAGKIVQRIMSKPSEMDYGDVKTLLRAHGWAETRQQGSHVSYTKPGFRTLVMVAENGRKVRREYLKTVRDYLGMEPLHKAADPDRPYNVEPAAKGGCVVWFPMFPGCSTHVEDAADVPRVADEIRQLWIASERAEGRSIPVHM